MDYERRTSSLFENHEQANQQKDQSDQIDVNVSRRPILNRIQVVEVGVVIPSFWRKRRTLDQVMNLSTNLRLIEVNLNVFGAPNLFTPRAARNVFAFLTGHTDGHQLVAWYHACARGC